VLTTALAGDPAVVPDEVASIDALRRRLGLVARPAAGAALVADEVAVVFAPAPGTAGVHVHWAILPHGPALLGDGRPVRQVAVVVAAFREVHRVLRLVARLAACLHVAGVAARTVAARSREELVGVLARVEGDAGERPLDAATVLALAVSSPAGLSAAEARARLAECGPNAIESVRRRSIGLRLLEQLTSFFAALLWVAAAIAFVAGMPQLGWAILAVIVVNGVFSFFQEYRAERAVEALAALLPREITVMRDGAAVRRRVEDLVPGDVVQLEEGDQVPADGQLVDAEELRVDQAALSGESHPVFKLAEVGDARAAVPREERHELVFAGTGVVAGRGTAVVTATGMRTEIGGIARLTQAVEEETSPLQREMKGVTRVITALAVALGIVFLAVSLATGVLPLADGLLFALGVIVANVPEGLLPTVTLALALGVQRMARRRCLVKRLSSVEALGATTVICTDKTGTLTENRMAARWAWVDGRTLAVDACGADPPPALRALLEAATLASQATVEHGDPTEVALVEAAVRIGIEPAAARAGRPLLAPHPFDSFRKRMTLVRAQPTGPVAFVKGAPRETLALCTTVRRAAADAPLDEGLRTTILAEHDRLAAEGFRLLAVAMRTLAPDQARAPTAVVERDLVFLGFVALWDPPRPGVREAAAGCREAGIRVVMVTGDYGLTARAIAQRIGLPVTKVVIGSEVEHLPPEALRALVAEPGICFARTSPVHKLAIVTQLEALGEVVAVTGDGVNDAPALKAAAVGVAMGRRGSQVAKEAAVVVVTDDEFATIVEGVRQGRAIYANVGKFMTYILASNVPELVPFLAFVLLDVPLPLTLMQILAVDLGTDLLPALALGAEAPEPGVMRRPPRPRTERLLSWPRFVHAYGFLGMIEAVLALAAFYWTYALAGWRPGMPMAASGELYRRATTMTLAAIVAAQVGNVFACRTERASAFAVGLFANRWVLAGIAAEIGLLALLILVPPLAWVFGLAPVGIAEWGPLCVFPFVLLGLEETRKWIVRRTRR
jgi:calcium-translocating P-type ATPase